MSLWEGLWLTDISFSQHNDLAGLQGGQANEYYHLTNSEYNQLPIYDSHIADGTIHFLESSISHLNISDIGINTHVQIDTHLALVNEHIDWTNASDNFFTSGTLDVNGHSAFGATASVSANNIMTVGETFSDDVSGTFIGQNIAMIANPGVGSSAFYKSLYSYVFTTGASNSTTGTLWGYQGFAGNSCGGGISVGILLGIDGYALLGLLFSEANNTATDLYGARGTADAHSSNTGVVASNLYGVYAWAKQRGKGTVNNVYGLYALSQIGDVSGNITNAFAIRAVYSHVSGTTTNSYGVYIDKVTGATNNFGLVLAGDGIGSDIVFGAGQDAKIYYTGFHLIIDSQVAGGGDVLFPNDNQSLRLGSGAGGDAEIYYDGSDFVINPQLIGSGGVKILNMKSGATQAAAGAAADELWKTNGHATLPDNVVMIGV